MSTVVDYQGRLIDMLAFQGVIVGERFQAELVLVREGESGEIIAGIVKLAQRFLLELLTEDGTIPHDPIRGTSFMRELRLGRVRTTIEAEQEFSLAINQLQPNLVNEEPDTMPDDERFDSVTLNNLIVAGDTLTLDLTLTSIAGAGITILLPLTVTIG